MGILNVTVETILEIFLFFITFELFHVYVVF